VLFLHEGLKVVKKAKIDKCLEIDYLYFNFKKIVSRNPTFEMGIVA
jgi:hypothetical protein